MNGAAAPGWEVRERLAKDWKAVIVSVSVGGSAGQAVIFCESELSTTGVSLGPTPIQVNTATVASLQHSHNLIASHALLSEAPGGHFCLVGDRNKLKALLK